MSVTGNDATMPPGTPQELAKTTKGTYTMNSQRRPYPGLGKFLVVQDIGSGKAVIIDGANTETAAKAKARKYPGTVSLHPNEPGSPAIPGVA